jgi:hypothetical protein
VPQLSYMALIWVNQVPRLVQHRPT